MKINKTLLVSTAYLIASCALISFSGCKSKTEIDTKKQLITVWAHSGQESERNVLLNQVKRFNEEFPDIQAELTLLPEGAYNAQLQSAALAGKLPDIIEFDGPFLYNYVWQNQLRPLDDLLPAAIQADLL
ncbi:MAG: extracellular solute-binding protein, partial [Candidatus Electrothrix sp. AR4]|nr:extracellular solute-binding protein [Candidatus Electrothrix sp. AR4]